MAFILREQTDYSITEGLAQIPATVSTTPAGKQKVIYHLPGQRTTTDKEEARKLCRKLDRMIQANLYKRQGTLI